MSLHFGLFALAAAVIVAPPMAEAREIHAACTPRYRQSTSFWGGQTSTRRSGCTIREVAGGGKQKFGFLKFGDPVSIRGTCVAPVRSESEANAILSRAKIKAVGAGPAEKIALAKGVNKILELGDGNTSLIRGQMVFKNSSVKRGGAAFGQYKKGFVEIFRSGRAPASNSAHLIHELGHQVGSREGLYSDYKSKVPHCQFSGYCRHVNGKYAARNEEFAEVFAAFILHPEILKDSPNCRKAYDYFAKRVFPKRGMELAKCNARPKRDEPSKPTPRQQERVSPAIASMGLDFSHDHEHDHDAIDMVDSALVAMFGEADEA